jgi:tagaturonate reductase
MANPKIQILQFGTGNFLRAFIGSMVQDLNESGKQLNICLIQSTSGNTIAKLAAQHYEYHLLVAGFRDGHKIETIRKINCVKDGLSLPGEEEKFFEFAHSPHLKWIISNVTEAGMVWNDEGPFEKFAESFAGRITQWLYRRFLLIPEADTVILPCELLPQNGELLKGFVLAHSKNWNLPKEFNLWIKEKVIFFNSLVDRIVPGFPSHLDLPLKEKDPFIVQAEPYALWAIEGLATLSAHLPFLESNSEVILEEDISVYSLRKVRILNASHTAMTGHGLVLTIETVGDWIASPERESFLLEMIDEEIIPSLNLNPAELKKYGQEVIDRFKNPFVSHKLSDISLNSISKAKSRIIPILLDYQASYAYYPQKLSYCLISLLLFYLRNPDKIRDSNEIVLWFQNVSKNQTELDNLKLSLSHWLHLEWDPSFDLAYSKLTQN